MKSNSKLQLSKDQLEKISQLEQDSFLDFCRIHGYDPQEEERQRLSQTKESFQVDYSRLLDYYKSDGFPLEFQYELSRLLTTTDFWTFNRSCKELQKLTAIRRICDNAHALPINYQYLNSLCNQLNISTPILGDSSSLNTFLSSIPVVTLFDPTFNASVRNITLIDDVIPCVYLYEQLLGAGIFIDVVFLAATTIISEKRMISPAEIQMCRDIGSEPSFQKRLKQCIDLVFGNTHSFIIEDHARSGYNPIMMLPVESVINGAASFVWFHEIWSFADGTPCCETLP